MRTQIQTDRGAVRRKIRKLRSYEKAAFVAALFLIPLGIIIGVLGFFGILGAGSQSIEQAGEALLFFFVGIFMFWLGIVSIVLNGILSIKLAKLEKEYNSTVDEED